MPPDRTSVIPEVLRKHESEILAKWLEEQRTSLATRGDLMPVKELHDQSRNFLRLATEAAQAELIDTSAPAWADVRELLGDLSRSRAPGIHPLGDRHLHPLPEAAAVHADPALADIPVIVVTAKALGDRARDELAAKVVAVLSKDHSSREAALASLQEAWAKAGLAAA